MIFLKNCLAEQVLPKSAPPHLRCNNVPFTNSARAYLEEACSGLRDELILKREEVKGVRISDEQKEELKSANREQNMRLDRKLKKLCSESKWADAGRDEIITNLSASILTESEKQALSLGLKFDTGNDRCTLSEGVSKNQNFRDSDMQKGFVQGILIACKALADNEPDRIPLRSKLALDSLAKDESIVVTSTDKGGGVIVMNKRDYDEKMQNLLSDITTYRKEKTGFVKRQSDEFNKKARKCLRKSSKGRKMQ